MNRTPRKDGKPKSDAGKRTSKASPNKSREFQKKDTDSTSDKKPFSKRESKSGPFAGSDKFQSGKKRKSNFDENSPFKKFDRRPKESDDKEAVKSKFPKKDFSFSKGKAKPKRNPMNDTPFDSKIRLNRFIANAGICSRREADSLISNGLIEVNGKVVTELGTKVGYEDSIKYAGEKLRPEKSVYVLMNKPKDVITTVKDPQGRKTIMDVLRNEVDARIYPVGRLDRDTTGLILLTNDGDLAKKLTHPSHEVKKIYRVTLDKVVQKEDLEKLLNGIILEDGISKADAAAFVNDPHEPKKEIGIELHSGKNRVVRRMMEALGYEVKALDRVMFAGMTKKNLPRGKFRFLEQKEINMLKMLAK